MDKISTLITATQKFKNPQMQHTNRRGPSEITLSRLRQFAHAYCATSIGGIVMN